jgi:Family of unknown function (DUF6090)
MIVRRLSKNLKDQNWTAIAIEFVLLVLGVFLGIQVANWNVERETKQKAAVFTARLKSDLRHEAFFYQYLIEYNRDVLTAAENAVKALTGKAPLSDEQLLINAYRATQYKQPQRFRASYDEMISTGNIGLIKDQRLRLTAMRIYNVPTMDSFAQEGVQSRYREAFRMGIDNDVQLALAKQCGDRYVQRGDYQAILNTIDYPCKLNIPQSEIDEAVQILRSNPQYVAFLRVRIADIGTRLFDMTVNNQDILVGLEAVTEERP